MSGPKVDHPEEVQLIRAEIPLLNQEHPLFVELLWRYWSEDAWSSGFLNPDRERIEEFRLWVLDALETDGIPRDPFEQGRRR